MNQSIEFKAIPGQFNIDEAQGMVECFVAGIGNKDSVGDVLISGAFTKSLTRRKPRVVWGHNWNDPIGKVLEIYEVAPGDRRLPSKMLTAGIGGLYAKVQFNLNSEKGREAFANVAFFGQEQEWSIGYKTLDSIFDPSLQANILKEVELYEVSPVLHGANQLTGTISVKSDETSMTDEAKGGMMVLGTGGQIPGAGMHRHHERRMPNILEANKPGIGDEKKNQLEIELAVRAGAPVKVRVAEENMVIFDRMTPEGAPTTYRVAYHNTGREFMFGKPERVAVQTVYVPSEEESGSRVVIPSQMPSMPMHVKPEGNAYTGDDQNEYQNIMPKSYDNDEKWVFDEDFADLANIISDSLDLKVGRALSAKNMSRLKAILENLQQVIASAEKDVEVKTDYIIPVKLENAFETKQLLDPIFDYHRVESHVTEDGIVVTSGVTQDFMEAISVAEKALGRTLSGGLGKLGSAARGAARFDPNAWDGDGDGIVQEGTPFKRPAIPGVNDRSTGGRVDADAATRAFERQGGLASSSVEKKPEVIRGEIVRGPGSVTPATKRIDKAVERGVVAPEHAEIIRDILSDLTPENIKDGEGGDILGEIRRKFVKAVQSGKFDNYKDATVQEDSLDNYIDYQLKDLISDSLSDTLEANINRRYASKKENDVYDEIRDEVVTEFTDNLSNAIKVSNKNKPPSDKDVAAAKDNARKKLSELIGDLEEGGEESEITSQELYEIVREIVADDPSVDVADMFRLLERAAEDGYATNPDNYELEKLYDELKGQSQNKGTLEEFEELKLDSEYLPERIEARRTLAGGLASTGRMRDEDNFDEYDEAFGPVTRGARRGMSDDPVGDAASENIDRDRNASAVRSGLASTVRGEGTMLARDGQIRRDERGNVDPTEAREARAAFDQNIFNKLRELGFNDDDIEKLTGVADGGRVPEGAKPAQYVPDDIGKGGLASESRVTGKLSSRSALQRVNRQPSKNGTQVLDNAILMDFLSGMSAKEVDEKYSLGGPSFAYNAANREFGRLRRNSDSRANSDMDLLMYRASGLSVNDASGLFGMSPREVRKTEKRLQAKLRDNIEDDDLLYLRSGLSLEQAGKVLGVEPQKLRQMEQAASRRKAEKIEKAKGTGGPASGGRDTDKREMDMTLAEYAELDEVLKKYVDESQLDGVGADEDMQIIQNILDKIDESSDANDSIPLTDKEIDDYIDTLTRMKDNGPVEDDGDKESITKLIDSLKKTKESSDKYYGSEALKESGTRISPVTDAQKRTAKNVRAFRSASGTINPHKKLDIELTEDEIGLLRDEVESLSLTGENKNIFNSIREKLEKAKNGKFSVDDTEYEETIKAIEQSKSRSGAVSSDLLGVLEQAAETDDGKFSSLNLRGGGLASTNNGKKPNNGAPPDITEAMQKDYIFWARSANARNLRLVQDALREFEKNDGQLPPSKWQRLRTMYTNMGPGSAKGGRRGIFGRGKGGTTEKPSSSGPGFVIGRGDAVQKGITVDVPSTPLVTDGFEKIGGQGGSQPGGKFKDPNTGTEYYIKEPKTKLHAENESLVSMLYQKLGVGVGKVRVGERQGKPKIVSEWLPGSKEVSHGREMQNPAWKKSVQDGFVADAWLANWDATGNPDNIKMGSDGKAYRVDTGGGLFFRARGAEKGSAFGPIVGEMETLRDPRMNSLGASYFGDIPPEEIAKQVAAVGSISDGEIRKMVEGIVTDKSKAKELSDILIARRDYLVKNWSTGKNTGGGRRARTSGLASSDDYSRRPKQSGVPGAMRPADFEVRGEDGGGGKGSAMGAEGTKFAGLSLDEAKPGNWDELSNEEKLDWLMYEGNPKKVAEKGQRMSLAAHEGAIKKVSQDIEREERRSMTPAQRREARIAEQDSLSEVELERQNTERKKRQEEQEKPQKPQKTYKPKENAEEAKKQRTDELQDYQDKIEDIKRRLGGLDYEGDFNPSAEDIWETVYALLGDEDITKRSISDAVSSLEDYIETNSPGENRYEKLSISSAKTLLKQLDKTSSKYENDPWIIDDKPVSGLASRAKDGDRPRPGSSEMPQSNAKRENEMKKIIDLAQQVIDDMKSNQNSVQGRRARVGGLASSSGPKAMITDEATFFKDIETSLQKEIRAAQKAKNRDAVNGLSKLQEIITRNEASKTGSRRTNVGSIYLTADEADMVLNGLMFALDSQIELGGDKRIEWYSKLLEKVSKAAMSTFINKNT